MVIFYVCMRERAKKSPFYVAYTQIGNLRIRTFACEGNNFANRVTRICVHVTEPKKSQPKEFVSGTAFAHGFLVELVS
jgi:hypothetical protein